MGVINKKVVTTFVAGGNLLKKFGLMTRASAKFGKTADKSFRQANAGASLFRSTTKSIVAGLGITRGISMIGQGLREITSGFIAFDKAAIGAAVRFKDIGPEAKDFNEQLKNIKRAGREAGATTEFTAAQATEGLNFMAKAGWKSAEAIGGLASMINLATSTGEDFARVADISSDLLGSFGLNADNTADKIANLNRLNDVLVKTSNSANVTVEDMFETMTQVGPVAAGVLGASLEEVAALTGVLGNSGIKGSKAMTALKNAYLRLAAPTSEASKTLRFYNITMKDGEGGVRKMTDVLAELGTKIKDIDPVDQAKILDQLFGKRAIAGGKNLMNNVKSIKELEAALISAGNTSQKTAEILRMAIENKLKALGSAATEAGFKILEAFEVDGKKGIDALTESIRNFNMDPIIKALKITAGFLKILFDMKEVIFILAGAFVLLKTTIVALNIGLAIASFVKFVAIAWSMGGAMGALSAAMALNPIGAFVIGFTALVTLFVVLEKKFDVFSNAFDFWMTKAKQVKDVVSGFLGNSTFTAGFDPDSYPQQDDRPAPNKAEAKAAAQQVNIKGQINVNGPAGTTVEDNSGLPGFGLAVIGQN